MSMVRRPRVVWSMLPLAACALAAPPVGDVLHGADDARDAACAAAIAAFRGDPHAAGKALCATRLAFATADHAVQQALVAAVEALHEPALAAVFAAERDLPGACRDRVLALATVGEEAAQAALAGLPAGAPARVDAELHLALHLTFTAWANGITRSLLAGYGPRIRAAADAAVAADPEFDHGAPLRLLGRFLAQAPWPVGDTARAEELLRRAVATAPLPLHHLFLGDVLYQRGNLAGAVAEWQAVQAAEPDATTRDVAPFHRAMAAARLRAAAPPPTPALR